MSLAIAEPASDTPPRRIRRPRTVTGDAFRPRAKLSDKQIAQIYAGRRYHDEPQASQPEGRWPMAWTS